MKTLAQLNAFSAQSVTFTDEALGAGQVLANRYQINGVIDTAKPVMENIELLCSAAATWLSYDIHEGKWGVVINQTDTAVASFDDTNIIGNISVGGTGLEDLYNTVKVEFPHRELRDNPDFFSIAIPSSDRNANEQDNTLNISYDVINDPVQANLLGAIELKQSRVDLIINFATDFSYINLKAGDIVNVTDSRFAFTNKPFRIITIVERQDDDDALMMEITALEYNANVYSTADLYKYIRTDENGIVTIGNIGVPGTPQVSKIEVDSRPRIIVESTAPSGIVDGMEFWITNDVTVEDDGQRSYRLLATNRAPGGGTFASGSTVRLEYDQLSSSEFFIKTRGFNSVTVGQFSSPSGLTTYNPTQVTNGIDENTKALSVIGGIATVLTVLDLLKSVDGLFGGNTGTNSIFKQIFDLFKDETGVDIVDQAVSGTTLLTVQDEGVTKTTATSTINFVGDGVVATASGNNVTVTIGASTGTTGTGTVVTTPVITSINPPSGPTAGGTEVTLLGQKFTGATALTFDNIPATSFEVISDTAMIAVTPAHAAGTVPVELTTAEGTGTASFLYRAPTEFITIASRLPPDRTTFFDPINNATSDTAPIAGSYFIKFGGRPFYGPLSKGQGQVTLYRSDGTVASALDANALIINNNVVELPFPTRELGTDYYIVMDEGVVEYCGYPNLEISVGEAWNFNTPLWENNAYSLAPDAPVNPETVIPQLVSINATGTNVCPNQDLIFTYNRPIGKGAGAVSIKQSALSTALSLPVSAAVVKDNTVNFGPLTGLSYNTGYYIQAPAGLVNSLVDCHLSDSPSAAITASDNRIFTTTNQLQLINFDVESLPLTDTTGNKVNPQTNIGLIFNKVPRLSTETLTVSILRADGVVHQDINVNTSYLSDKTNELIWVDAPTKTVWLNPTKDLQLGATYYVQAEANSIMSLDCKDDWAGISDTTTVRFTVDPGPTSLPPTVPNDNSLEIQLNYDRNVEPYTGQLTVVDSSDNIVKVLDSNDSSINYE